jgi:hypothetical protein
VASPHPLHWCIVFLLGGGVSDTPVLTLASRAMFLALAIFDLAPCACVYLSVFVCVCVQERYMPWEGP